MEDRASLQLCQHPEVSKRIPVGVVSRTHGSARGAAPHLSVHALPPANLQPTCSSLAFVTGFT